MFQVKIAVIGQGLFGADVYRLLQKTHNVVAVFTIPDKKDAQGNPKPDALGKEIFFHQV